MNAYAVLVDTTVVFRTGSLVSAVRWARGMPCNVRVRILDRITHEAVTVLGCVARGRP